MIRKQRVRSWFCICLLLVLFSGVPAAALEGPGYRIEGRKLIILEGIERIGRRPHDERLQASQAILWDKVEDERQILSFDANYLRANEVTLPDSLRMIGAEAFMYYQFESLRLPEGLAFLADDAFYRCRIGTLRLPATLMDPGQLGIESWLTAIEVPDQHPSLKSVDGVLFSRDGTELICYPNQKSGTHYDVPAGVKHIRAYAFHENHELTSVSLPLGLQSIGRGAFLSCGRLGSIALPLTLREIHSFAFSDCVSLQRVSMVPGVVLGEDVFENCPLLEDAQGFQGDNGSTESILPTEVPGYFNDDFSIRWRASDGLLVSTDGQDVIPLYDRDLQSRDITRRGQAQAGVLVRVGNRFDSWCYVYYNVWQNPSAEAPEKQPKSEQHGFVKKENVLRLPRIREFDIVSLEPRHAEIAVFDRPYVNAFEAPSRLFSSLPTQDVFPYEQFGGWICFGYHETLVEDGETYLEEQYCWAALRDFNYRRKATGDQRVYAILAPEGMTSPLLEGPSPTAGLVMHAYAGSHVEVLAREGDYWKVRLGSYHGYMDGKALLIVSQQAQEGT